MKACIFTQISVFGNNMAHKFTWESAFSVRISSSGSSSLQAYAILMAVSCLSPVNTQICRPAFRRAAMVSGTPSCSRSSIPVAPEGEETWHLQIFRKNDHTSSKCFRCLKLFSQLPKSWRFVSRRKADSNSSSSLPWMAVSASRWCCSQQAYCSLFRIWHRKIHAIVFVWEC